MQIKQLAPYCFTLLLLMLHPGSDAPGATPPIRNYSREMTGGGAQNWDITQGENGVMYFANNGGLLAFNSRDWTLRRIPNGSSARSLCFDALQETLYCGSSGELYQYSRESGEEYPLLDGQDISVSEIWNIHTAGGQLWFQDDNCIYRLSPGKSVKTFRPGDRINCSALIGGSLIAALQGGKLMGVTGDHLAPLPGAGLPQGCNIRSLCEADGKLIVVTEADGVYQYEGLHLSRSGLLGPTPPGDIFCATVSGRYFAVGTISHGIYIEDLTTGETLHLDTASGLQNNTVLSLQFDRENNLWAGLDNGIDYICLTAPEWQVFGKGDHFGTGYASASFASEFYFGTNQGLFRAQSLDDTDEIRNVAGIRWQVWSLDLADGAMFCSHDKGLDIFYPDGRNERVPLDGCWKIEPLRRHPGVMLGCTYERLFTLVRDGGKWRFNGFIEGFPESSKSFEEDYDGRIWFSHHIKGLYRIKLSDDLTRAETVETFSTDRGFPTDRNNYPNEYGDAIVFSTEGGFFRYDNIAGRAVPIDDLNGVFTSVPAVAKVVSLTDSLEFFSSGSLQTLRFLLPDGTRQTDSLSVKYLCRKRPLGFESTSWYPGKGVLVNTDEGFSIIRTDGMMERGETVNDVFIRTVQVQDEEAVRKDGKVQIPYKSSSVTFSFICPNYERQSAVRYSCILEGFDKGWTQLGNNTFKEYTHLPDGDYVFRVKATDESSGHTSECVLPVKVEVPPFKSPWALFLYALLAVILALALVQLFTTISGRRAAQLARKREEALKQEQTQLELSHKAEELAASTGNLIRKNEILTSIDADLERLKEYISPGEGRAVLRKIRSDIRENITHDDDWQKFSTNFDLVYNNFLSRLGEQYPALTNADKRLCAYLKMGLSSKEIAPLTDMTVRSVEMTRHRLRKKLALPRDVNLTKYLQDF